jgi:hypothetical protein
MSWLTQEDLKVCDAKLIADRLDQAERLAEALKEIQTWLICPDTNPSTISEIRNLTAKALAQWEAGQ